MRRLMRRELARLRPAPSTIRKSLPQADALVKEIAGLGERSFVFRGADGRDAREHVGLMQSNRKNVSFVAAVSPP